MNKILLALIVFTIVPNIAIAQEPVRKILKGKVIADAHDLEGIYVINLKTEKSTLTDSNGNFSIPAAVCDTLMFSSIQFKGVKIEISAADFDKDLFFVKMRLLMNQLKEVMVFQYKNINAVALGIIPKGQRSYTPAERKLATASSGRLNPLGLDPILNLFSGRTAMLRKEVEVEKKEILLHQIENMFDKEFFVNNLKIPEEYIKGFQYYIVENTSFVTILNAKNKSMASFLIGELAVKYNEIICDEK